MINGAKPLIVNWKGLNSSADPENARPDYWTDSNNVLVNKTGTAVVLRSPANFNDAYTSDKILSAFDYDRNAGNRIIFDLVTGGNQEYYYTTGTSNTTIATGITPPAGRTIRLTINDKVYQVDGEQFRQYDGTNLRDVGIVAPTVAPTISWVAGGSGSFASGVDVTYAYRLAATGDVSKMSATSNRLTASTNSTLRIAVTASPAAGTDADGIVIFLTLDGGSVRYLLVDSAGAPQIFSNSTGNIDVSIANIYYDQLTTETAYNDQAPETAFYMSRWRDRIMLLDFRGATTRQQIQYSGFEAIPYGTPFACFPPLNIINIPNKADAARSGISTNLGFFVLGEQDAYLLSGYPSDKTSSPENTVAITEHLEPMNWNKGTIYPKSLVTTPYGEMWLDQNRQIQLWTHSGFPVEVGAALRNSLSSILTTSTVGDSTQAVWFDHPKLGGMYVLTSRTTGSTNNKIFVINLYQDPESGEKRVASWTSDIAAECLVVADISGVRKLYAGMSGRLREIFDVETQGAGWGSETRFFQIVVGAETDYAYWHSLRFDAASITGLTITCTDMDTGSSVTVTPAQDETAYRGLIDAYGYRKIIKFAWSTTDTTYRDIKNLRIVYKPTGRVL